MNHKRQTQLPNCPEYHHYFQISACTEKRMIESIYNDEIKLEKLSKILNLIIYHNINKFFKTKLIIKNVNTT